MTLALTVPEAMKESGLGRTSLYEAIGRGDLPARKHGRRTLILAEDLRAFLEGLPALRPTKKEAA